MNSGEKPRPPLPEGPFLVVGLARSGAAIASVLAGRGETVLGADSGTPEQAAGLEATGVEVSLGVDGTRQLDRARTLVKSPGVPEDAPVVHAARERGIEVTGELELAWRLIPNAFCAVTGTNGKTTTSELIGHLHRTAGRPVAVAGNVGTPLASLAGAIDRDATVVCECSSFQLEDASHFSPECAVFINLAPDHLDRHGTSRATSTPSCGSSPTRETTTSASTTATPRSCAAATSAAAPAASASAPPRVRPRTPAASSACADGVIFAADEPLLRADELQLLGAHNVENAMAAAAAALASGLPRDAVAEGLRSFPGVRHRLERVGSWTASSTSTTRRPPTWPRPLAGIRAFDGGVRLIAGGRPKRESFAPLAPSPSTSAVSPAI